MYLYDHKHNYYLTNSVLLDFNHYIKIHHLQSYQIWCQHTVNFKFTETKTKIKC